MTPSRIHAGPAPDCFTQPASSLGTWVRMMKREKMNAPTTMKKIAAVVYAVSSTASPNPRQSIWRVSMAMRIATKAATAAASVGENEARDECRRVQLGQRLLGDDGIDGEQHRRRNQYVQGSGARHRAGGER